MRLVCLLLAVPFLQAQALYPWLEAIAQKQLAERRKVVAELKTPEQIRAHGVEVRAKLLRWMGGLPAERTPLRVRKTGTLERDEYRVEKIVFESQPRFYVTANLYIPTTGPGPFPAVLQPTGHSLTAKARELYQSLSIGLAKYGFVVLTYDPLGQGERRIFFDPQLNDSKVGGTTVEHQMVGVQSLLAGESLARHMVWDGMRGLDLLAARPEVDAKRLGVAGCSGGGTLTAYLAALDPRVQAAAPACYITAWEEQLTKAGPQDAEQQFPDQLRDGFDHGDFLIAMAPKPYLIASTTEDFFPLAGAKRTYEEAKYIYNRFGAEDKIAWFTAPGDHGMRADTRGAIYSWMRKWLQGKPGPAPEPKFTVELEEDLDATATGQVVTALGGETVSSQNIRRFESIEPETGELPKTVAALTRYEQRTGPLAVETAATEAVGGMRVEALTFAVAGGRRVPGKLYLPEGPKGTVLVADALGRNAKSAREIAAAGYTVLALDTALTGETGDRKNSYSAEWFPQDKSTWLALMVGKTVMGLRMGDLIGGADLLAERKLLQGKFIVFGRGNPGVAVLHAAAIDARFQNLVVEDLPPTYRTMATTPIQRQIFDVVVPGVLRRYDYADLATTRVIVGQTVARPAGYGTVVRRRESATIPETYFARLP